MRKSHRQKVADRREKRQRRGRQKFYDRLVSKFGRRSPDIVLSEAQSEHLLEQARRMDDVIRSFAFVQHRVIGVDPAANAAGKAFISALVVVAGAAEPATKFLSSMEALNPGLLERVRPGCEGTGDTK